MELIINRMPFGVRPEASEPGTGMWDLLGEEGIRKMVNEHYDLLAQSKAKHLFPSTKEGLDAAKKRSADFFIQRLGGPDYFNQNRGEPRLIARHRPFRVDSAARIIWLESYRTVLMKLDIPEQVIMAFWKYIHDFSNWMVNTPDRPSMLMKK